MRRYNIVPRILLFLTVITFTLTAPVPVEEEHRAPEDVITLLAKRSGEQQMNAMLEEMRKAFLEWENENMRVVATIHPQEPAQPLNVPASNVAEAHVQEVHVPAPNPAGVHVPPQGPADPARESMELYDDGPPGTPESGHSGSQPTSPGSTKSEDWYTAPSSPSYSTDSDSDSERWSTSLNAPSADSQSENLNAPNFDSKGKAKVSRRISGTASRVDTVDAALMELRSADPVPFP